MHKKSILKQAKANVDKFSKDQDAFAEGLAKYKAVPLKTRKKLINKLPKSIRKHALELLKEEEQQNEQQQDKDKEVNAS